MKILSFLDLIRYLNIIFSHQLLSGNLPSSLVTTFNINFNTRNQQLNRAEPGLLHLPRMYTVSYGNCSISSKFLTCR